MLAQRRRLAPSKVEVPGPSEALNFFDALRPGVDVGNLVWWLALGCVLHAQIQFRLAKRIGTAASMFLIARVVQIASSM